jgi:hypothetical protein
LSEGRVNWCPSSIDRLSFVFDRTARVATDETFVVTTKSLPAAAGDVPSGSDDFPRPRTYTNRDVPLPAKTLDPKRNILYQQGLSHRR